MSTAIGSPRPWRLMVLIGFASLCLSLFCPAAGAVAADPGDDAWELAVGFHRQSRWTLAEEAFQKFLREHPRHTRAPLAKLYLADALVHLKQYQKARGLLDEYVRENPTSARLADAVYKQAECSYFLDEFERAAREFEDYVTRWPREPYVEWALPYLGDCQLRLNRAAAAEATFRRALKEFPQGRMAEDCRFGLARAVEQQQRSEDAIRLYREIAENRKGSRAADAQLALGTRYFDDGQFAEAAEAFVKLAAGFPESPLVSLAHLRAGYAFYNDGNWARAIAEFDKAAAEPSQAVTAGYWKGLSQKRSNDLAAARKSLSRAYEAEPDGPLAERILFQWGLCTLEAQDYAEARRLFLQLADRWPKSDTADDSLHFAADAALLEGALDEAGQLLARFDREYPDSELALPQRLLKGRLAEARGGEEMLRTAVGHFEAVLRETQQPRTAAQARFALARALQKSGDHARVLEVIAPLCAEVREGKAAGFAEALLLQAGSARAEKQTDAAAESLLQYTRQFPQGRNIDEAWSRLAAVQAERGDRSATAAALSALADRGPDRPVVPQTTLQAAEITYAAEKYEWSSELFEALLQFGDTPWVAAGLSGAGWSLYHLDRFEDAAARFGRLVQEHPEHELAAEAAFMRGKSLEGAGRRNDAVAAYRQALERFAPAQPAFLSGLQAARLLRTSGQTEDADTAYAAVLEKFPKPEGLDRLLDEWALLHYEAGNFGRADDLFRRLIEEAPESDLVDNARLSLAESDLTAGRLNDAREVFEQLAEDTKADRDVQELSLFHLVGIAMEQSRWDEAVRRADLLRNRFPDSAHLPFVSFQSGEAELHRKRLDAARDRLEPLRAGRSNPDLAGADWYGRVWVLLAEVAFQRKQYEAVATLVDELRDWSPENPFLYQADEVLGRALKQQAKFADARQVFERAIAFPAAHRTETAAKCQFLIAETRLFEKNHAEALKEYLKVYHLYSYPQWQAPALFQAARCDEALQNEADAISGYEQLVKEFPDSEYAPQARKRLEEIRRKAGS